MTREEIDCVVTHHLNAYESGVSRFNEILAARLDTPLLGLFDDALLCYEHPLLSFKAAELNEAEVAWFESMLDRRSWSPEVFLHTWDDTALERRLLQSATRVWAGNHEVLALVAPQHPDVRLAWTPGLLLDQRTIAPAEIKVFSFGMAHKIQTDEFRRLRELLEATGRSYALLVSSANHATSSILEAQAVYEKMLELFPTGLYFLGNLSDLAVFNEMRRATFFASFFPGGARANNTSVAAAMEQGSVVITNLDRYSPPHLVHGETVIDVHRASRLPQDIATVRSIGTAAADIVASLSWERLAQKMRAAGDRVTP